jgi:nitrous oxidase accessory protein NosD
VNILIRVTNAPETSVRANHLVATGAHTLGECGYGLGITVRDSPRSTVAWNRVREFHFRGINVDGSNDVRIRGNTVRSEHPGDGPVAQGIGIGVFSSLRARIRDNVIASLSSAGDTTLILQGGIAVLSSDGTAVTGNVVHWVQRGIQTVTSNGLTISDNRIRHASLVGLKLQTNDSTIANNSAKAGGDLGIDVYKTSQNNDIVMNDFRGNSGTDCVDQSAGPANTWTNDLGDESSPAGLCTDP